MDGIREPVGPPVQAQLRRAVWELARTERRRRFPPVLHAGEPGAAPPGLAVDASAGAADLGLRTDVVVALVHRARRRTDRPLVWLTRPGCLSEPHDSDLAWLAATRAASAELSLPLPFVVVSRRAWHDPGTGVGRVWRRPRPNRKD